MLRVEQRVPWLVGCGALCPSTGSWLLPVANTDCSALRTQTLPSPALHTSLFYFIFSFSFKCVHLLDNCMFYFLSQTRKKCVLFSCIVYKVENKTKQKKRGKKSPQVNIFYINIVISF